MPVGLLTRVARRRADPAHRVAALFADAPAIDRDALHRDLDRTVDPEPRIW